MLKKLSFLAAALILTGISAGAQEKIPARKVVTSDYNRNSISLVTIQRGDSNDSDVASAVRDYNLSSKFDINNISTKTLRIRRTREESVLQSEVTDAVGETPFAQEILATIFNRKADGTMDDKTVRYRGNYDAKDQDVINARASRVGVEALGDLGHALVKGSYIVAMDFYNVQRSYDKRGNVYYSVDAKAYAYRIGMGDDDLNNFYEQCWIYDDDNEATREAKNRAFRNLNIGMVPVAYASSSGSSNSVRDAALAAIPGLFTILENRIPEWEVAVGIIATKPLRAKIGTKEGLTNGARYRAYSYTEDRSGQLKSVKRGYLRATTIASNTGMSIGETEPSEFYQISGMANVEEGWTIKQSNDYKIGVMPYLRVGGISTFHIGIDVDWLMNVKTNGTMLYVLGTLGVDPYVDHDCTNMTFGLGGGYGIHFTRLFEITPYAMATIDYLGYGSSGTDSEVLRSCALVVEPGVRAAANVAYPLQAYVKVFGDLLLPLGDRYRTYNSLITDTHRSGVGLQLGFKWTF